MQTEAQASANLEAIRDKLALVDVAMVAYQVPSGEIRSEPLQTARMDKEGNLWFFISDSHTVVAAVAHNPRINLVYLSAKEGLYISLGGVAQVIHNIDLQRALWSAKLKPWFPEGPAQDTISLLKVELSDCEYWDEPKSNLFRMLLKAVNAVEGDAVRKSHRRIVVAPEDRRQ